jgi:hypothetical protein
MNRYDILLGKDVPDSELPVSDPSHSDSNEKIAIVEPNNIESAFQLLGEVLSQAFVSTNLRYDWNIPDVLIPIQQRMASLTYGQDSTEVVLDAFREHVRNVEQRDVEYRARKKRTEPWKHGRKKDPWEK